MLYLVTLWCHFLHTCSMGHRDGWLSRNNFHRNASVNVMAPAAYVLNGIGFQDIASVCRTIKYPA